MIAALAGSLALAAVLSQAVPAATSGAAPAPVRVTHTFRFSVAASMAIAAPLFGPEGEKAWAGESWQPTFLYPQPAADVPGAVFTTPHGGHTATWVNTVFDMANGRVQYIALIPGVLVTMIDVRLTAKTPALTSVEVTYTRTALDADHNEAVLAMGKKDETYGPEWEKQIAAALQRKSLMLPEAHVPGAGR